jgi:septal ring factor EnvC (AmiA/AmiB activator)
MNSFRRSLALAVLLAVAAVLAFPGALEAETAGKAQRERTRLLEMKKKAEKAAAELAETLKREKTSRGRVSDLQQRLARQRSLIARIDKRLDELSGRMEKAEREARSLEEEQGRALRGLAAAARGVFCGDRDAFRWPAEGPREERLRYLAQRVLSDERDRYGRLVRDREEKERVLTGLERRIEDSERRMAEQRRLGEKLLTQEGAERRKLREIEKRKKDKEGELKSLKERIARLEAVVSRVERAMREKERRGRETVKRGPSRFSGIPGGLVPPLDGGRIVGRFGRQHDPVFDVTVENRGVEIEGPSEAAIRAVAKGESAFVGSVPGFGKVLILRHGSGLFSVYGKAGAFSVKPGQEVAAGETVGRLPANPEGKSVLYLELRTGGTAIDPTAAIPLSR